MSTFTKLPQSPKQQIQELSRRGLIISDLTHAEHIVRTVGYYRLSGYALLLETPGSVIKNSRGASFYTRTHRFELGVTFDDLYSLYELDHYLRHILFTALERIEVAARNELCNHMAMTYRDAHWFLDKGHFNLAFVQKNYNGFIEQIKKETAKNQTKKQNRFCAHYYETYTTPALPPVWMVAEQLSMGVWSRVYAGLSRRTDKKNIAGRFDLSPTDFESWIRALSYLRNLCAHHARLIGVNFVQIPNQSPKLPATFKNTEFAMFAALIQYFLKKIDMEPIWGKELESILRNLSTPAVSIYSLLGFYDKWFADPFWH